MDFKYDFRTRTDMPILLLFIIIGISIFLYITNPKYGLIIDVIGKIALPLITFILVYETYKLNRANYRLTLFDKRYEIYTALITMLKIASTENFLSGEEHRKFQEKYLDAKFLFKDDVINYLNEINEKISKYLDYQNKKESEEKVKLRIYFSEQISNCDKKFAPYLYFQEY